MNFSWDAATWLPPSHMSSVAAFTSSFAFFLLRGNSTVIVPVTPAVSVAVIVTVPSPFGALAGFDGVVPVITPVGLTFNQELPDVFANETAAAGFVPPAPNHRPPTLVSIAVTGSVAASVTSSVTKCDVVGVGSYGGGSETWNVTGFASHV